MTALERLLGATVALLAEQLTGESVAIPLRPCVADVAVGEVRDLGEAEHPLGPVAWDADGQAVTAVRRGWDTAEDRTIPPTQGQAMFTALRQRGIPAMHVIYPREGHPTVEPAHALDRMHRVLDWFAKYGGVSVG